MYLHAYLRTNVATAMNSLFTWNMDINCEYRNQESHDDSVIQHVILNALKLESQSFF